MYTQKQKKDVSVSIKSSIKESVKKVKKRDEKNIEIGKRLKELRKMLGETQEQLAFEMGLSQITISKMEIGDITLTLHNLLKLADHYNVSLDYLCNGIGDITVLETLKKHVNLTTPNPYKDDINYLIYPLMEFDRSFYEYLIQIYYADNSHAPNKVKENWYQLATEKFLKQAKKTQTEKFCFVPVPQELIYPDDKKSDWKQADLLRETDNYFRNIMKET